MAEKTAAHYRGLPYTRRVAPREEGGHLFYLARIEELPSIEIHGDSREAALARLSDIFDDCVEAMLESGDQIAEPALWPTGLFGAAAKENLKKLRREAPGVTATTQLATTTHKRSLRTIKPWTDARHSNRDAMTASV